MNIGFVLFGDYFQKRGIGSSRIRGRWVIKYLNGIEGVEAESFVQGKEYDAIVFQKAYWREMAREFKGVKILDICDPDWLDGADVVSFCRHMDAVTVPTEEMKFAIERFTDTPVFVIPDGEDFETLPSPKIHDGTAKTVLWYGYSHNMDILDGAYDIIKKHGLTLRIVSDGRLNTSECQVENVQWDEATCDEEYQKADFAIFPRKKSGRGIYKSDNKTTHAWALGLPVARTPDDVARFMNETERIIDSEIRYQEARRNHDVKKSAELMYEIICRFQNREKESRRQSSSDAV